MMPIELKELRDTVLRQLMVAWTLERYNIGLAWEMNVVSYIAR